MEQERGAEREPFRGKLAGGYVVVCGEEAVSFLADRGYGLREAECLRLSLIEAAYLMYRGLLLAVDDSGEELHFDSIVTLGSKADPDFWTKLNVYSDLRNRALTVFPGVAPLEFLIDWKRKDKVRRYLVRVVKEGARLSFKEFEEMFRRALESDRVLVLAIVDKEGVVSYYTVEGVLRGKLPEVEDRDKVQTEQEGQESAF